MTPDTTQDIGFDRQFAVEVNGVPTEIVFHGFANKWFLVITQLGKIPGIFNVTFDVRKDERILPLLHGPVTNPEFHVSVGINMTCCLGLDTDEIRSAIQFLVNRTGLNKCPSEFVIGLGLKTIDGPNLRSLAKVLEEVVF